MFSQLLTWSSREFGHLPWRQKRSLYGTLVSEIMLQQTTVGTVLQHYERFLKRFPDLASLASATEEEMLIAWKGLGYYRRAKNLKKIAEAIASQWDGQFPARADDLQSIPGIGPYTANALLAIGMDQPALAVDANLERVLSRLYGLKTPKGPRLQKQIAQLFMQKGIIPERHLSFRALNEALMDLGRTICQAGRAACEICPVKKHCQAHKEGQALAYPMATAGAAKKSVEHELKLLRVIVQKGDEVLAYQKEGSEWLAGQWELPTFVIESDDEGFKQYAPLSQQVDWEGLPSVKTGITKYAIQNYVLELSEKEWKTWDFPRATAWRVSGDAGNLSTASVKCLKKL